jgi:hypothetical protein
VTGLSVGRAIQQLSQRTEVVLRNVTVEEKRMYIHRYERVFYKVLFCMNLAQQQDRCLAKEEVVVN